MTSNDAPAAPPSESRPTEPSPIVFLIPSYRPTDTLCSLLVSLRLGNPSPIVIVDDGSGPAYATTFARAKQVVGTTLLTNAVNLGKGAALKHGMNNILVNHLECIGVVTADADGQHAVEDILMVANHLREAPASAIFGARVFGRNVPFRSKVGNMISRYAYRLLIGVNLTDTQTGLRGIPRRLMELCLNIRSNRYEFETEQLAVLKWEQIPIREIPIETIYIDDNKESHFRPLRDSAKIYFVLLRYSVASIITYATDILVFWAVFSSTQQILLSNMTARLIALWVQLALLQSFVFKRNISLKIFLGYIALVFVSGFMSSALQIQLLRIFPIPLIAKITADTLFFVFNFLFIRDLIFGRWTRVATED
jgi:glycosyltransferase involved in cell wall biosynthesis